MQRLYRRPSEFTRKRIRAHDPGVPGSARARVKPEILAVTIRAGETERTSISSRTNGRSRSAVIARLELTEQQRKIVADVLREIESRCNSSSRLGSIT
jgi:hypothetical protein